LVEFVGEEDQDEQQDSQSVLKMVDTINDEVPDAKHALVSVRIDLVVVYDLIRNQLMPLASFEFHLFLEELILVRIASPLPSLVH
jgi:hypothetical protein